MKHARIWAVSSIEKTIHILNLFKNHQAHMCLYRHGRFIEKKITRSVELQYTSPGLFEVSNISFDNHKTGLLIRRDNVYLPSTTISSLCKLKQNTVISQTHGLSACPPRFLFWPFRLSVRVSVSVSREFCYDHTDSNALQYSPLRPCFQ